MSDNFESMGEIPRLPEHYKKRTMVDMFPDEVAHLYSSAIVADKETRFLYVDRRNTMEEDAADPSYYGNRVGVMRIFGLVDGEMKDGFIADLRHAAGGQIYEHLITLPEDASEYDKKYAEQERAERKYELLLAAIIVDEDGEEHIIGDSSLTDHLAFLRNAVEEVKAKAGNTTQDQEEADENNGEIVEQPTLFELEEVGTHEN